MAGLDQETTNQSKRRMVLQQLVLLLHAYRCMKRESGRVRLGFRLVPCKLEHCQPMREVLIHITRCNFEPMRLCPFGQCFNSRKIMNHWNECSHVHCAICGPLANNRLDRLIMDENEIRLWLDYEASNNNYNDNQESRSIET